MDITAKCKEFSSQFVGLFKAYTEICEIHYIKQAFFETTLYILN